MSNCFNRGTLSVAALAMFAFTAAAAPIPANCTPDQTVCYVPENQAIILPFLAFAGDVVVLDADMVTVSDVFRIFNDIVDTGGGTGLGDLAYLGSADDGTLPDPSTYSANVQFIPEGPDGITHFFGNGTEYILDIPEPGTFGLLCLGFLGIAGFMRKRLKIARAAAMIAGIAIVASTPGWTQALDLADGPAGNATYLNTMMHGPAQVARVTPSSTGLPFYAANYQSLGTRMLRYKIVGTDPSLGAATTTIPTVIVPLKFVFPQVGSPTLDGTNVVPAVQNSPIFLTADYTVGGTDLGITQFGDALQRGEFWNLPGFSQAGYHVLLGTPTVAPTITINLTPGQGVAFRLRSGGLLGIVGQGVLDAILAGLLPSYTPNQLPIFVTDNVVLSAGGSLAGCCTIGFHNSEGAPLATSQTWIFAAFVEAGTFVGNAVLDVQPLSHEVAEWLNDPFVGALLGINFVPPAVLPGLGTTNCTVAGIINFETGDPLENPPVVFTKTTNSTTYHLQDEVFMGWYLHSNPSFSVNGWFTLMNTFTTPSTLCGPG